MTRRQWQAAIRATVFPVGMRPVKATLLSLPVDADGRMSAWRNDVAAITGLPVGTLKRHLASAVSAGWLTHEVHGGHGRRSVYRVTTPTQSCGPEMARKVVELWPIHYTATTSSCGPSGGPVNKESANVSEHGAVDELRERRINHDATRAERVPGETTSGIDRQPTTRVRLGTLSPWARLAYAPLLRAVV